MSGDDYLWDKSGEPDRDVERLERALAPLRYTPQAKDFVAPRGSRGEVRVRDLGARRGGVAGVVLLLAAAVGALGAIALRPRHARRQGARRRGRPPRGHDRRADRTERGGERACARRAVASLRCDDRGRAAGRGRAAASAEARSSRRSASASAIGSRPTRPRAPASSSVRSAPSRSSRARASRWPRSPTRSAAPRSSARRDQREGRCTAAPLRRRHALGGRGRSRVCVPARGAGRRRGALAGDERLPLSRGPRPDGARSGGRVVSHREGTRGPELDAAASPTRPPRSSTRSGNDRFDEQGDEAAAVAALPAARPRDSLTLWHLLLRVSPRPLRAADLREAPRPDRAAAEGRRPGTRRGTRSQGPRSL